MDRPTRGRALPEDVGRGPTTPAAAHGSEPASATRRPTLRVAGLTARHPTFRAAGLTAALVVLPALTADAGAARTASASFGVLGTRTVHATATTSGIPGGERILLEGRQGGRPTAVRDRGRVRGGVARLRWTFPTRGGALHLRVRVVRGTGPRVRTLTASPWRVLRTGGLRRGARLAPVRAADVVSAPAPGTRGDLVLRGRPAVAVRDVVALGPARTVPAGLLVRVGAVRRVGETTVVATTPATLPDVMPVGDLSVAVAAENAAPIPVASPVAGLSRPMSCDSGFAATVAGRASLAIGLRARMAWRASTSLERPNVTADVRADVRSSLDAGVRADGGGACVLGATPLYPTPVRLRTIATSIGPLPVTLTADGQVVLSGSTSTLGRIATAARGSGRGTVRLTYDGIRSRTTGRLRTSLRPHDDAIVASGGAQAGLTQAIDLRLFGLAGPQIDLAGGVRTAADILRNPKEPWWTTVVRDELGAGFALKALRPDLEEPRVRLDGGDHPLSAATSPPGGSAATGSGPSPDPLPPGVRARLTWDSPADLDLHAWDVEGHHLSELAPKAIPGAALRRPEGVPTPGEELHDGDATRAYTFGVCLYAGTEAAVVLDVREPDGSTGRHAFTLRGRAGAVLATVSPSGAAGFSPPSGWCGRPGGDPTSPGQITTGELPAAQPRRATSALGAFPPPVRQDGRVTTGTEGD